MPQKISNEHLELLSISEMMITYMLGDIYPDQVQRAKEIVEEKINEGEEDLRLFYSNYKRSLLHSADPSVKTLTNYLDYLRFIYNERPKQVNHALQRLSGWDKEYANIYPEICSQKNGKSRHGFMEWLQEQELYLEAAYTDGPEHGKQAALILVRRKDTDTAIRKIARRLVEAEINNERKPYERARKPSYNRPPIDDIFGIKVVAYNPETIDHIFQRVYYGLGDLGFQPEHFVRPIVDKITGEEKGKQLPGVDDHHISGRGRDSILQIKVCRKSAEDHDLREIGLTDVVRMLVDEMEHISFRQRQERECQELLKGRREYVKRYALLVDRGNELVDRLPQKRMRVLTPGEPFRYTKGT